MTASGEGYIRLLHRDANGFLTRVLYEGRTEPLDISTDPRQMVQIGIRKDVVMRQDDEFVIQMKGDSATVVDNTCVLRVPVTKKSLSTGVKMPSELNATAFGLSATDVTIGTDWTEVGKYTVPAQTEVVFGKENYDNSQLFMQMAYT